MGLSNAPNRGEMQSGILKTNPLMMGNHTPDHLPMKVELAAAAQQLWAPSLVASDLTATITPWFDSEVVESSSTCLSCFSCFSGAEVMGSA